MGHTNNDGRSRKKTGALTIADREKDAARAFQAWTFGFALDGFLPGNQRKSLVGILAMTPQLVANEEFVNGVRCLRVMADTEYGNITVWLDPSRHYSLRKAYLLKERGNRYDDSDSANTPIRLGSSRIRRNITNIVHVKVGPYLISSSGTIAFNQTPNGQAPEQWVVSYKRGEFDLEPVFEGTDAFKMDFADGARVSDRDAKGRGNYYVWRDNRLVPQRESVGLPNR